MRSYSKVDFEEIEIFVRKPYMKTFIGNGYPRAFVHSAAAPRTPREPSDDDDNDTEKPPIAFLPYVAGVSERIRKVCRDFNIKTVFKSAGTHPRQPTH